MATDPQPLACPNCARRYPLSERFCRTCEMPLTYVGRTEEQGDTARQRARKVKPQYVGGELVKVGWGRNQAEAELIQGLLLEEGIPSVQRRTRGFDVPDFLAGGPRDILVAEAARETARALLGGDDVPRAGIAASEESAGEWPLRLAAGVLVAAAIACAIVFALYQLAT